jgi:thioredoxin reductase (NADPH)
MPDKLHKLKVLNKYGKVKIKAPYQLADIKTHGNNMVCIRITGPDGLSNSLLADSALLFFGLTMNLGNMTSWGLQMDKKHIAVNPATMATSIEGIYAAGDIVTYPGKLKLILTGFAEAALACRSIHGYLNPTKSGHHFAHSTSRSELFTQAKTDDTK